LSGQKQLILSVAHVHIMSSIAVSENNSTGTPVLLPVACDAAPARCVSAQMMRNNLLMGVYFFSLKIKAPATPDKANAF
jgi:uncharacterized protein (DUF2062 family)